MTIHRSFKRGKRVFVQLKDGTSFVAKFNGRTRWQLVFSDHDPVDQAELRSVTIYRAPPTERKNVSRN